MATSPPCLICYDVPLEEGEEIESFLERDSLTVFVLRCLLQVDQIRVDGYLKQEQKGPAAVIRLCEGCRKVVTEAQAIYEQLVEIGRRFREKQKMVVERIWNWKSGLPPRSSPRGKRARRRDCPAERRITEEVRHFVKDYDYEDFQGPLLVETSNLSSPPVKEEVEEQDSDTELVAPIPPEEGNVEQEMSVEIKTEQSDTDDDAPVEDNLDASSLPEGKSESDDDKDSQKTERKHWAGHKRKPEDSFGVVRCPHCPYQTANNGKIGFYHVAKSHRNITSRYRIKKKQHYHCCDKTFLSWELLHEHRSLEHQEQNLYICSHCPEESSFPTGLDLRQHAFKCHDLSSVVGSLKPCPNCKTLFKTALKLKAHQKECRRPVPKKSKKLPPAPEEESTDIFKRLPTPKAYACHLCPRRCTRQKGLNIHLRSAHQITNAPPCPVGKPYCFPCPDPGCSRVFQERPQVEGHYAKVHTQKPLYPCDLCDKGFYMKSHLRYHQQRHHGNEQFVCETCGYTCTSQHTLYCHRSDKHPKKPAHLLKPTARARIPKKQRSGGVTSCEVCGKALSVYRIKHHMDIVHQKKYCKYKCHVCGLEATCQKYLDAHLYTRHQIGERPPDLDKQREYLANCLKCEVLGCARKFRGEKAAEALEKHGREAHGESGTQVPFACQFCGKGFSNKWRWQQHEMIHTNKETKPFKCEFCGKGFTNRTNCRYHELNTHKAERMMGGRKRE